MKNRWWIILVLLMSGSCLDETDCLPTGDTALIISFKKLADGTADEFVFYNIEAEGSDSIFYKTEPELRDTLSAATVAVNPFVQETLFTFILEAEEKTLRVGYKNEVRYISEECGSDRVQYDLKVLETQFDSVRVVNNVLSKSRTTNIEIYN